ncbi:outer membrane protein OmpA-like peptidoglycan-associated protein [Rhodovulum iodosum]|uniref:Outer membrane protein OmpA-like peptidoglycan-associated protein n=1 Tax=Rhodovulum iodosum TaxID=68291 RepID=A0ABV3XQG1_9RHOB|nr:OmpA family protein [Rhodovulum robiginosum]RSK31278.1 OmpA family protein [Rhodovulum robiginosum]
MTRARHSLLLTTAALVALTACTDPNTPTNDPYQRTKEGAMVGGLVGGVLGAITADDSDERGRRAVVGAALGAAAGGVIGNQLDKQAAELRRDFGNDSIMVVNTGDRLIVTMPQDILFPTDSATVNPGLQGDLRVLAGSLNDYPNTTVDIIGHTDNTGASEYNQDLSARRATSVASVLTGAGVSPARLRAYGRGEDQPVASNLTPEGRAQNRRVEIVILPSA